MNWPLFAGILFLLQLLMFAVGFSLRRLRQSIRARYGPGNDDWDWPVPPGYVGELGSSSPSAPDLFEKASGSGSQGSPVTHARRERRRLQIRHGGTVGEGAERGCAEGGPSQIRRRPN